MSGKMKRCLMIGAGGMARGWIDRFFPSFSRRSRIVALVDIDEGALHQKADQLGLPPEARFTDFRKAFDEVEADYCTIVTPPWVHRSCIEAACRHRMAILTEKPIAGTWKDVVAAYRAVRRARVKCTVIQNYRYNPSMYTFRAVLREQRLGRINYIMGKYMADYRHHGAWGAFRHEIPHSLLIEGAVHHFDMLRNLAGSAAHADERERLRQLLQDAIARVEGARPHLDAAPAFDPDGQLSAEIVVEGDSGAPATR